MNKKNWVVALSIIVAAIIISGPSYLGYLRSSKNRKLREDCIAEAQKIQGGIFAHPVTKEDAIQECKDKYPI